jgi:hypothetical protein
MERRIENINSLLTSTPEEGSWTFLNLLDIYLKATGFLATYNNMDVKPEDNKISEYRLKQLIEKIEKTLTMYDMNIERLRVGKPLSYAMAAFTRNAFPEFANSDQIEARVKQQRSMVQDYLEDLKYILAIHNGEVDAYDIDEAYYRDKNSNIRLEIHASFYFTEMDRKFLLGLRSFTDMYKELDIENDDIHMGWDNVIQFKLHFGFTDNIDVSMETSLNNELDRFLSTILTPDVEVSEFNKLCDFKKFLDDCSDQVFKTGKFKTWSFDDACWEHLKEWKYSLEYRTDYFMDWMDPKVEI